MEPPKKLITRIFETCFLLFLSALLIRWGVRMLMEIWLPLLLIAIIAAACVIGWRVYRYYHNLGKW